MNKIAKFNYKQIENPQTISSSDNGTVMVGFIGSEQKIIKFPFKKSPEFEIYEQLGELPAIIPLEGIVEKNDKDIALVFPVAAYDLKFFLQQENKLMLKDLFPLADTLDKIHKNKFLYRDIHPANILYYNGLWCFTDFGLARKLDAEGNFPGDNSCPLMRYASPAQIKSSAETIYDDLYSFILLLNELITGCRPWQNLGGPFLLMQKNKDPFPPELDKELKVFIQKTIDMDPRMSATRILQELSSSRPKNGCNCLATEF
ncbi:MAG: protein kinase [Deltaproteobacteria bacterium]|jgi:serine/threonine protein kinase|nr:protein kinase [Deltaproteobacteria bacterium]